MPEQLAQVEQSVQLQSQANHHKRVVKWSIASGVTLLIAVVLIAVPVFLTMQINQLASDLSNQVGITIWLNDDALTEGGQLGKDATNLLRVLEENPNVDDVYFVNKDEALERFTQMTADSPEIIEQLEGNPLPTSLEISLNDPQVVEQITEQIVVNDHFLRSIDDPENPKDSISYFQPVIEPLLTATQPVRIVSSFVGVLGILLGIVAFALVGNTIRIAIVGYRERHNSA
ncbi:MAG: permease-like cell division protein FtsX [Coriobacteriia bacterium]|nr:permease-like cell division protein FtsX [Coriobacteriia bacterium]